MHRRLTATALIALWCAACATATPVAKASTDPRLDEAQNAFDESDRLKEAGQYAAAIPLAERALTLREAVLTGMHPKVAEALSLLGQAVMEQADYARAEPLLTRALQVRETTLGKNHPDVAESLVNLATLYRYQALYSRAEPLLERALQIRETALGKNHPDVAVSLNELAGIYSKQGLYARSEPLYVRTLQIVEAALGEKHRKVATALNNLAFIYHAQGFYTRAEPLYVRALESWEAILGENHPDVAIALCNLAFLYVDQGRYTRAELLMTRALKIQETVLGENHPDVANSLNNLAILYTKQGLYARAEPLYVRSLKIQQTVHGENHPSVARRLTNLASLYTDQHRYERSEALLLRALQIQEATLGKNHLELALSLSNLANLYIGQKLYTRAEPLLTRALQIRESSLGPNHPDIAHNLSSLAAVYKEQGLYARAEPLHARALQIREAVLGEDHPSTAFSLNNIAALYQDQGLYEQAQPLFERALKILEATLGETHPKAATTLTNLAINELAQQHLDAALPLFERAFTSSEQHLRQEVFGFSEKNLTSFLDFLRTQEARLYALARAHPDNARILRLALSAALLRKGRSVQEVANTSLIISHNLGPADRETFERLRALRTQLASLSLGDPGKRSFAAYQQRLKDLAAEGDALEADLARRSAPLRALTALPSAATVVDRVAEALPSEGALIELISYEDKPLLPTPGTLKSPAPAPLRYLALILWPDGHCRAVDLGPAAPIDKAGSRLRDALARRDASYLALSQAFYQLAFKPLLPLLGSTRRIVLSTEGQLHLVAFAALHDGQKFLLDAFDFSYVTSGKDLLPRPEDIAPSSSVVVLADPGFGAPQAAPSPAQADAPELAERSASALSALRTELSGQSWTPLPGTRREAEALQRLIPRAQLFLGPDATKERLLHLPTPGVLHIATHGFFLGEASPPSDARGVGHFGALGESDPTLLPADPLLRSGLALAGAGAPAPAASSGSTDSRDSGLITALELTGLNLWGTELVVLSACDTGRGDIKPGQGVYGLRRSFIVAGAETVVMSLWKVNDDTTSLLMEAYYRNLLAGQGRGAALREAMRSLRASKPHPHYWAPFIALGRDAPLHALAP